MTDFDGHCNAFFLFFFLLSAGFGKRLSFTQLKNMKEYEFKGYSDDTFGEEINRESRCNNGDEKPIQFELRMPDGAGIRITGCYGTKAQGAMLGNGCWMIGVESLDEKRAVDWLVKLEPSYGGYQGRLTVQAPDEAVLTAREDYQR